MNNRLVIKLSLCALFVLNVAEPVFAHHSFAGYDMTKTIGAQAATIKEFRWGAPHSAAIFMIKGADGKPQAINLASGSPTTFMKQGFKPKDFRVGDKVDITWNPSRSGAVGGLLASMKLPDGRTFKNSESQALGTGVSD
jgi:hypothetical protein